jgi:hypothetical protein
LCAYAFTGVEIRGRPVVRDHHFLGQDDHVLTDGSLSDDQIFALIIELYEKDHYVLGRTTMFFKDYNPSGNHRILVNHHPCKMLFFVFLCI